MAAVRTLPDNPSLEYERKEAKRLLKQLKSSDAASLDRALAQHPSLNTSEPKSIKLADSQLVIAREYGFTSWPRLVEYFEHLAKQTYFHQQVHSLKLFESMAKSLEIPQGRQRQTMRRVLAAYVPRFYGAQPDDLLDVEPSEYECRLAVARMAGFANWKDLESASAKRSGMPDGWESTPFRVAWKAIQSRDLTKLRTVVTAYPDVLSQRYPAENVLEGSLLTVALGAQRNSDSPEIQAIIDWLVTQGFDLQKELNTQLCGRMRADTDRVRWLISRGADPNGVAPNGVPILEHALVTYWNGEAVDEIARGTRPRKALWIAAGLGNLDGVRKSLDEHDRPLRYACKIRPPLDSHSGGLPLPPPLPDPTDEELLVEAFFVAMLNGRIEVLDYMCERGFPIDSMIWDMPLITFAIGNRMTSVVECLVRNGADLDLKGTNGSARDAAKHLYISCSPPAPEFREIARVCGVDPDEVIAEHEARPAPEPVPVPVFTTALELAADDAHRQGLTVVTPENLLFGAARSSGPTFFPIAKLNKDLVERFQKEFQHRLLPNRDRVERPQLELNREAQEVITLAVQYAKVKKSETLSIQHILAALATIDDGLIRGVFEKYGPGAARVKQELLKEAR